MLIIFDFDNTLEEFAPHEHKVEAQIFQSLSHKYGLPVEKFHELFESIKHSHEHVRSVPKDYDRREWFRELFHVLHLPEPVDSWVHIYWSPVSYTHLTLPTNREV